MGAPLNKNAWVDPSLKAENILDYVLEDTSDEMMQKKALESSVEKELQKEPVVVQHSEREKSRVLFVLRDTSVLENDSLLQMHFKNLSSVFDEIHVLIIAESWQAKRGVERIGTNIWAYTTSAKYWWSEPFSALTIAKTELQFTDGFRPDLVVAFDPFEAGLSGLLIARKFNRDFQVHVTEDFYTDEFKNREVENKWRLRIAKYVLKRTQSVRTTTKIIAEEITKKFKHIKDISVLPRHYDIAAIIEATNSDALPDAFPQFAFVALFVGKLDYESTLFRTIDATRAILHSKSIGLVVVGDGPNKKEFQQRAEILGIQDQIIFQKDESKLISYLKSANILLCTDTTEASDEIVIKAAAAGLPLLIAKTQLREDLFVDGESAFLCDKEDTVDFSQKLAKFLNMNSLREQFSLNAKDIIKNRLHEDPEAYKLAYRDSIESVFALEDGREELIKQ